MGIVHPIHVLAKLAVGTYRPIDAIDFPSELPGSDHLDVASHALSVFNANRDLIQLELARANTLPDHVWNRDVAAEAWECEKELEAARNRFEAGEGTRADVKVLERKAAQLRKEEHAAYQPQFPVVRMCLILGVLNYRGNWYLHRVGSRPWNSPPDWGGRYMWETGCTILNLTDGSFAYVVPGRRGCGWASKSTYDALKLRPLSGEQYLKAFGQGDEYHWPVRARGDAAPAPVMPMTTIQAAWPSFPCTRENDSDEEDGGSDDDDDKPYSDLIKDSSGDKCIFRDESQHINSEANHDERGTPIDKEQPRKLDLRLRELLLNYTKPKLLLHRFEEDFPAVVDAFIREHSEEFTPAMPGAVPLLLTARGYHAWKRCHVEWLDLSRYHNLPGETVVQLVRTVIDENRTFLAKKRKKRDEGESAAASLRLLDVSFNHNVTADHMARILDLTRLDKLCIWDNPALAAVSDGRIAQLTSRERFLDPLRPVIERQNERGRRRRDGPVRSWPPPPMVPGPPRQLVWTTLKTTGSSLLLSGDYDDAQPPPAVLEWLQLPRPGSVSLEQLDVDKLAWIQHPCFRQTVKDAGQKIPIFGETVAFPLHDFWAPRHEVYTSVARFEEYMTSRRISRYEHGVLQDRWPLKLPLAMAAGHEDDEYAITSPFPAELFDLAWEETVGNSSFDKQMRLHGFDAIVPGESTLVFLHEVDLGLVHYGLATRAPGGRLEVRDPAAAAREAGDEAAARAWERGFAAKATRQYRLLDPAAVGKLQAASTRLAQKKNRIKYFLRRFLEECVEEADRAERQLPAAAPEEHEDAAMKMEQEGAEVKKEQEGAEVKESGPKRALWEQPEHYEAEPRMKRLKRRLS
ncbi:hypothetical protein FJTKL_11683 [Diaporthe vaccinii]|uniref:Uncharacterized protein n=1 Tax=Diaporthe vaccinii TaxID=105482 RepID=A0ABR4EFL0_9PEZI